MARSAARRLARRDLAWIAAGYLALQFGLALAIDQFWMRFRDPVYCHKLTRLRSLIADSPTAPRTIVFLGSSRTGFGLQAGRLSQCLNETEREPIVCFNFGMPGSGPVMESLSLRRLLAEGVRPTAAWIEVVPMFLAGQESAPSELDRFPAQRFRREELALLDRYSRDSRRRLDWWLAWPAAWHAHRFEILSELVPSWVPLALRQNWTAGNDPWGWGTVVEMRRTSESQRQAIESERVTYFGYFLEFQLGGPACAALRDALTICRDARIPAALYFMPESAEFRSWYPPEMLAAIDRFVAELSAEFGVPIVDARGWIADAEFSDGHHLLPSGAAVFTDRLAREPVLRAFAGAGAPSTFAAQRP